MINDLPHHIQHCFTVLFADDTQLIISGYPHEVPILIEKIQQDLHHVNEWMNNNRMFLNMDKTELLIIGNPKILKSLGEIKINYGNIEIKRVEKLKCLGLILDQHLSWVNHTSLILQKTNYILHSVYPLKTVISESNRKLIFNTYLLPIIRYMIPVWGTSKKSLLDKIDSVIRRAIKFVIYDSDYGNNFYVFASENLKVLFTNYLYKFEVLKIAFNFLNFNDNEFHYFKGYIDINNLNVTRSTRNFTYLNSCNCKRSFLHNATELWINLPEELKIVRYDKLFKRSLYEYLLNNQILEFDIQSSSEHYCNLSCIDSVINSCN